MKDVITRVAINLPVEFGEVNRYDRPIPPNSTIYDYRL